MCNTKHNQSNNNDAIRQKHCTTDMRCVWNVRVNKKGDKKMM